MNDLPSRESVRLRAATGFPWQVADESLYNAVYAYRLSAR